MITRIPEQLQRVAAAAAAVAALAMITALVWFPEVAEAQQQDAYYETHVAAPAVVEAAPNNADNPAAKLVGDGGGRYAARPETKKASAAPTSRVVEPGETLWSISQDRLGSGALPDQVGKEVERIADLNRDRIGNPDLIMPGQELALTPVETTKLAGGAVERTATDPVAVAQPLVNTEPAAAVVAEPVAAEMPDLPAVEPALEVREVYAPRTPGASFVVADERRLVGWGLILLSLGVGAIMVMRVVATETRRHL